MKKILLVLIVLLNVRLNAQITKAKISTEVLGDALAEKRKIIEKNILNDILSSNSRHAIFVNNATYNTFHACLNSILNNTNKQKVTQDIIRELTLYVAANTLTLDYFSKKDAKFKEYSIAGDKTLLMSHPNIDLGGINARCDKSNYYKSVLQIGLKEIIGNELVWSYCMDNIYYTLFNSINKSDFNDLKPNRKLLVDILPLDKSKYKADDTVSLKSYLESIKSVAQDATEVKKVLNELKDNSNFKSYSADQISKLKTSVLDVLEKLEKRNGGQGDLSVYIKIAKIIVNSIDVVVNNDTTAKQNDDSKFYYKEFQVDIESIILSLEDAFVNNRTVMKKTWFGVGLKPNFSIGFDYLIFSRNKNQLGFTNEVLKNTNVNYVGLASEKIGLKFMFFDRKYTHSFEPDEWFQYKGKGSYRKWRQPVKKNVMFTHFYSYVYFSGLLYKIAELTTNKQFNYTIISSGLGVTLYDAMDINFGLGWAQKHSLFELNNKNMFYKVSLDIPIFEYIKAYQKKRD